MLRCLVQGFRVELNFRLSAWDWLDAEPDPLVLANLLLSWMEHLKAPILDQVKNTNSNLQPESKAAVKPYHV